MLGLTPGPREALHRGEAGADTRLLPVPTSGTAPSPGSGLDFVPSTGRRARLPPSSAWWVLFNGENSRLGWKPPAEQGEQQPGRERSSSQRRVSSRGSALPVSAGDLAPRNDRSAGSLGYDRSLFTHARVGCVPSIPAQNLQGSLLPSRVPGMPAPLRRALRNAGSPRGWDEAQGLLEASAPRLP